MAKAHIEKRRLRILAAVLERTMRCIAGRDWHGEENLPKDRGFIAASNHVSYIDPATFAHYLFLNGHIPHFLAKAPLFDMFALGALLRAYDQIPVFRGTSQAKDAVDKGALVLKEGGVIAIFPEGTLTRDPDYWPMVARTGAARMALENDVPVIPVIQWGVHRILKPYGKFPKIFPRKNVKIIAGPEIDLDDLRGKPLDTEVLRAASDRIMDTLTAMLEDIRGEKAPAVRYDMRNKKAA